MATDRMAEVSVLRPSAQHKYVRKECLFRKVMVKACIQEVLTEELAEKQYNSEETPVLTQQLVQVIREKVKSELNCVCSLRGSRRGVEMVVSRNTLDRCSWEYLI
uniref:Uncharacterized protein n=1 Tax=Eptatretus burgeri TaxID=7764 RepID=A0A8C4Q2J9_EPTBU